MTFKESTDPRGCCTNPTQPPRTPHGGWETTHTQTGWLTSMTMFYNTCTQKWVEMGEIMCFCLRGHSAQGVASCRWRCRESDHGRAASGHLGASPPESSEMNINMNEGADQPAGKTGSRRKRAKAQRDGLNYKKETEKTMPIWRVSNNSSRWRKNRRDTVSGGMNGEKQPAAGKLTPLITSQHWPVLEVTFKVRTCVVFSISAPHNQVWTVAVTGRQDQQQRWREKIKIQKRGRLMWMAHLRPVC